MPNLSNNTFDVRVSSAAQISTFDKVLIALFDKSSKLPMGVATIKSSPNLVSVSYTHLTLPTNREV